MESVRLARMAMACRFEFVLHGDDQVRLRAVGEEALAEIGRIEAQLTIFEPSSEVSRVNARAAEAPVRISAGLFRLLEHACRLHDETGGAFDLTVAPLMRAWGFYRGSGHMPDPDVLEAARERTGMRLVRLDAESSTVRFDREGVMLDFGAIGKGFAVDEAVRIARDAGVESAFLHGGTSTMYAIGAPPDDDAWRVAIPAPNSDDAPLAVVPLRDESLSVSAEWGKAFEVGGTTYGHVLDPRLGRPVHGAVLAAVAGPSATESDALSTALLVEGGVDVLSRFQSGLEQRSWTGEGAAAPTYRALAVVPTENRDAFKIVEAGLPASKDVHGSAIQRPSEK